MAEETQNLTLKALRSVWRPLIDAPEDVFEALLREHQEVKKKDPVEREIRPHEHTEIKMIFFQFIHRLLDSEKKLSRGKLALAFTDPRYVGSALNIGDAAIDAIAHPDKPPKDPYSFDLATRFFINRVSKFLTPGFSHTKQDSRIAQYISSLADMISKEEISFDTDSTPTYIRQTPESSLEKLFYFQTLNYLFPLIAKDLRETHSFSFNYADTLPESILKGLTKKQIKTMRKEQYTASVAEVADLFGQKYGAMAQSLIARVHASLKPHAASGTTPQDPGDGPD